MPKWTTIMANSRDITITKEGVKLPWSQCSPCLKISQIKPNLWYNKSLPYPADKTADRFFFFMVTAIKISYCCSFKKNVSALPNFLNENWIAPWIWSKLLLFTTTTENGTQNLGFQKMDYPRLSWHWPKVTRALGMRLMSEKKDLKMLKGKCLKKLSLFTISPTSVF